MVEAEVRQTVNLHVQEGVEDDDALLAELRRFIPVPRSVRPADLASMDAESIVGQCVEWSERTYWDLNRRMGEERYRQLRQEDVHLRAIVESEEPFYREIAERLHALDNTEAWEDFYDQPIRRMPTSLESQLRDIVIDVFRLFRDRRLMVRQIDTHWVRHLTSLDMLREGINLRAVGQQNPLVAYQKEAYEMYQQMMASVQTQIVRSLFLVPTASVASTRSSKATPTRPKLTFRAERATTSRESSSTPQPHRAKEKPGRNDPCWCGSGKKYKDCHWRSDRQAELQR
jgi:preprotein translocase subunit SecA